MAYAVRHRLGLGRDHDGDHINALSPIQVTALAGITGIATNDDLNS